MNVLSRPGVLWAQSTPTMSFDNTFHDCQTKAQARPAALLLARLPESVEEVRQLLGGDSGAAVRDPEMDLIVMPRGTHRDSPACLGELDRVADQVFQYLQDTVAIGPYVRQIFSNSRQRSRDAAAASFLWGGMQSAMSAAVEIRAS